MSTYEDTYSVSQICSAIRTYGCELRKRQNDKRWRRVVDEKSLKTYADLIMNDLITNCLLNVTPDITVFSEENRHDIRDRAKKYWLIDPIDGTGSWLSGFDGFVTQVALVNDNYPILGIIYHPSSDRLWHNDEKGRVWCNGQELIKPADVTATWRLIDNYPQPKGLAAEFYKSPLINQYIECGSLGLKSILTLAGEADIFVKSTIVRDWDMAPALAIAECLQGKVTDKNGVPLILGNDIEFREGVIVSHHPEIALWATKFILRNCLM